MLPLVRGIREGGCIAVAQAPFLGQIAAVSPRVTVTSLCSVQRWLSVHSLHIALTAFGSLVRGLQSEERFWTTQKPGHTTSWRDWTSLWSPSVDTSSPFVIQWKSSFRCILLWNRHTCPFLCIICHETFEIQ